MTSTDHEAEISLRLTFGAYQWWGIAEVARGFTSLADLCADCYWFEDYGRGKDVLSSQGWKSPDPQVERLSKQSPLWLDLLISGAAAGSVAGLVTHFLKHPEAVGGWFPSLAVGWHESRAKAIRARMSAQDAKEEASRRQYEREAFDRTVSHAQDAARKVRQLGLTEVDGESFR